MAAIESKANPAFRRVLLILISLIATCGVAILAFSGSSLLAGTRPTNIGVDAGQLAPCPSTPNCVNSQSLDATHRIEPFTYDFSE